MIDLLQIVDTANKVLEQATGGKNNAPSSLGELVIRGGWIMIPLAIINMLLTGGLILWLNK